MSRAQEKALEGFICPSCVVDFPSALKLQDHWLNFHAEEENSCTASQDLRDKEPKDYEEILELPDGATAKIPHQFYIMPAEAHQFTSYNFKLADACVVCANLINSEGRLCKGCNYACHNKCENLVKSRCPKPIVGNLPQDKRAVQDANTTKSQTPPAKSLVTHLRHRVSKGRNRHVDEGIDLDLTYITERIIAMSFPASGLESTYRNSLRDVAKMLKRKHEDKYMVFNLSERRYDISQLNNQVLDFGWPDHLAPPLERLISIIKSIDSWLKSDMQHVVVVHCKGGKGRTGVVIAAYMHFSKMCTSPQAALDWFAMKRFCDDGLKGVTQPSQRRYVHYFSDFLEGKVALNSKPKFLHHVIIHGIPNFDGKGGCKPYLRVYNGLKLIYTSGIFHVTSDMERICITIENGLEICGDILVKCYNKNALPSGRDIIFRCQFNTGAIVDNGLVLEKSELDDSRKDKRFPDSAKVEFVFSLSGDFVADYKDNKRLQSILRHSLQPMENADVLFSFHLSEEWDQGEHIDEADQEFENCRRERGKENIISVDLAKRQESDKNFAEPDTTICSYIPGPVNGNLYAQVDKSWKERVRSHSLDSSSSSPYVQHNKYERGKAVTLGRPNQNKEQKNSYSLKKNRVQGFDYSTLGMSVSSPTVQTESRKRIPDMDGLLSQLNACTDFLDTAVNQHRSALQRRNQNSDNNDLYLNGPLQPQVSVDDRINGYSSKRTAVPVAPTRRAASFDATSRYQGSGHSLPAAMRTQTPPLEQRATLGRVAEKQDSYLPSPLLTSTPAILNNKANFGGQIFTASEIQTSPPDSPVKPKYFATQIVPTVQRAPAEVVNVTTQHSDSLNGFRSPHEESGVRTQAVCNGVQRVNQPVTIRLETVEKENNQKYSLATQPSDLNNNNKVTHRDSEKLPEVSSNGVNGFIQETRDNNVERENQLPEKGIVAANVALLSDMFSPTKVQYIRRPPLKGTVPMPGLTTKTAEEVSREISDYNAKALAPGEISHSSGTLYFTGLPPKRVLEKGEHEPIEVKLEILPRGITVETTRPEPRENEHGMFYHSPTGSFDQVSVDEGVESKADTDEIGLTLGPSPTELTQTSQEPELEVEPQLDEASSRSSISSLLEGAAEEKAEEPGKEKEEVEDDPGYARLEDIKTAKHAARNARLASVESKRDDVTSPSAISPTTQKTSISDHEAVHEIVTEVVSTNEQAMDIQESAPSGPATPYTNRSGTSTPTSIHSHRSPIHSGSDSPFGRERNKSGQQSDKGYGSTASVSSNNSSSSDVFFDGPRMPGIKFDKDTSALWYKPNISRDQTIELLKDKEPGSFIIRDSTSFKGFFGLALKVAVPPASVLQGDLSNVDMTNELVRHFLIESTKKGVRLRGNENDEPIFGSLSAFVYQHSLTPLALPLRLVLPTDDSLDDLFDYPDKPLTPTQKFSQGAVYNLMFMGLCAVELLTGPSAIERTVELLRSARELPVLAPVTFKVNPKGITLTDNNRKAFFRKHFDMKAIQYCGIDPLDKRWDLKVSTFSGQSRCFGLVVRKNGEMHNECHLFAEMEDDTPISVVVNSVNRYMSVPT